VKVGCVAACTDCGQEKVIQARDMCANCYSKWRRTQPGRCAYCGSDLRGEPGPTHETCLAKRRDIWHTYRDRIFEAYGPVCNCCGETMRLALTIDHVHGNGNEHRRSLGGGNRRQLLEIINAGFPPDYQILCYNCNFARQRNGGRCPHEDEFAAIYDAVMGDG
jgi:hypothetical protein